ncbi:hypothetical protein K443DRAFT_356786 [Laccaria amethystina LaAM-08-1]|jgi:hypothetical protein|uniref:Unplaced genomic scaffold K443scaffold_254, whole genome shotgun sequence n=1 Tax=Laccaria amethystina LaAM-08-1 TaxID=1095629 RepID=A0A0C9XA47_9AGAR|nr:hypothetical protein K443DRAFT_356786 [Laccaria amethystina LaAM-08-1]
MGSSPFSAHFDTNYAASDQEVGKICKLLLEPQSRLARLDSEISRVQALLRSLYDERDNVNCFIDKHRALITPIRRLPLDILQEIFTHCLPTEGNPIMSADETPLLLTRICSLWRNAAFSAPRLWSQIHIPVPNSHCKYFPMFIAPEEYSDTVQRVIHRRSLVIREWLDRSGACPVDISYYQVDDPTMTYHAQPLIDGIPQSMAEHFNHSAHTVHG